MENPDKFGSYEDEKENTGPERMAAYQNTVLALNTLKPCAGVFTYNTDEKLLWGQYFLLKLIPYVSVNGKDYGPTDASHLKSSDDTGKVICRYQCGSVQVKIELFPLLTGGDTITKSGGWGYTIVTDPACPIQIHIGGGKKSDMVGWKQVVNEEGKMVDLMTVWTRAVMVSEKFRETDAKVLIQENQAFLTASHPFTSGVTCDGKLSSAISQDGGSYICATFDRGIGNIFGVFSRDQKETVRLLSLKWSVEFSHSDNYYRELEKIRIITPEKLLNDTFLSAVYNMDYNYLAPYGWVEAIHHWMSIWHQQHCLAADWLGQQDRSKQVIESQAKALYPSGAAPMFFTNGEVFRGFGGTDHFFLWQVRHYLLQTDDRAFAQWILPYCEKVFYHSLNENDPGGEFRFHWGEQIGNQEDYISHLHESTSPTIEGINMLDTLSQVSNLANQPDKFRLYKTLSYKARKALATLWDRDLGRFVYQIDTTGKRHLEGQYQTYIYPFLYDCLDECDSYTTFRHMDEMLVGEEGELYCSNNFPNHMAATLGTQAGMAQQPWGAMAFAKMGEPDKAIKPLRYIAKIVADPDGCGGSWPEVADSVGSYFSPPAGVFIQAVVEYLFGLNMNQPDQTITIAPAFPSDWPEAQIDLPEYQVFYKKEENMISYSFRAKTALKTVFKWKLPLCSLSEVTLDGKEINDYSLSARVNGVTFECALPQADAFEIQFRIHPIEPDIFYERVVREGTSVRIRTSAKIEGVIDRSGVCSETEIGDGVLLTFREAIVTPYQVYGRIGLVNFSQRTVFLKLLLREGISTIYPLDFTFVPQMDIQSVLTGNQLKLCFNDYTPNNIKSEGHDSTVDSSNGVLLVESNVITPTSRCSDSGELIFTLPESIQLLPGKTEAEFIHKSQITKFFIRKELSDISDVQELYGQEVVLPENLLEKETCWKDLKRMPFISHMPWINQKDPMTEIEAEWILHPKLPMRFRIHPGRFIPLAYRKGGQVEIPIEATVRKLYVLLFSFLDNHDIFSPVLRITAERKDSKLLAKEYCYPGDLDGFWSSNAVGCFATAHSMMNRTDEAIPAPDPQTGLWPGMRPASEFIYYFAKEYQNSFPASSMWSDGYTIKLPNSVAGVIEFDLKKKQEISRIMLESIGTNTAFGILSIYFI